MTLLNSLTTIIDFVRTQEPLPRPVEKALNKLEEKAEVLRIKRVAHMGRKACPRCGANCSGLLCWRCWSNLPVNVRGTFEGAKTEGAKREAARYVLEFVRREKEMGQAAIEDATR